jgi:DNA-binding transcriptional ArsR family regulator
MAQRFDRDRSMTGDILARTAALLGDPARARMLLALLDAVELPAAELARRASVSAQTASFHLARLQQGGLLVAAKRGRSRVYTLARSDVAGAIEALMTIAPSASRDSAAGKPIAFARSCYDHLAGRLGVLLADALVEHGWLTVSPREFAVTQDGAASLGALGIDVDELHAQKRLFAKRCLDWTERRYHVAGSLGAALLLEFLRRKWIVRLRGSRVVHVTGDGYRAFRKVFGMAL